MTKSGNAARVQRRRDRMRAMGLRPVQIWVPDTRAPGFGEELARQCRLLAGHPDREADAWLDELNRELAAELDLREARAE